LKTTEEIYDRYDARDQAEQIKYFIKDAHESFDVKYVLLIGNIDLIPMRISSISWFHFSTESPIVHNVPSDHYYADLYDENNTFSDWDSNNDGIYSEVIITTIECEDNETFEYRDHVDLYPDISIGRLPCSTKNEVTLVVNKIIGYETKSFGSEWFNRIILMGGDTFPTISGIQEGEVVTQHISEVMNNFDPVFLWTSLDTFKPAKINKELSKGAGFVTYSGHGFEYGFATSPPNETQTITYYFPYLIGVQNRDKLPVVFFDACLTAALDFQCCGQDIPCFAWMLVKKPFGGAISSIGSTRVAYGGFTGDPMASGAPCLNKYFFESYEQGILLGDMFTTSKNKYIDHAWDIDFHDCLTVQEFMLIGDPSLKIGGYK
jgi:hypothetical protein